MAMTEKELNSKDILDAVSSFYVNNHFNDTSDIDKRRKRLNTTNIIRSAYPDLHAYLRGCNNHKILEAGCGTGWLTYLINKYYNVHITSVDQSNYALQEANKLNNLKEHRRTFIQSDLFALPIVDSFDCIISLGVLHHTHSTLEALDYLKKFVKKGGSMYIGLYHKPSRELFFNYIGLNTEKGPSMEKFSELFKLNKDMKHLQTWFNDQCLHVHETQHTLREIYDYANQNGLQIVSTSLNRFCKFRHLDASKCEQLDYNYATYVDNMIRNEKRFLPGFFTINLINNG